MRLKDIRQKVFSADTQGRGKIVGWVLLMFVVLGLVSPKGWSFALPIVALSFILGSLDWPNNLHGSMRTDKVFLAAIGFLAFTALSFSWSDSPISDASILLLFFVLVLLTFASIHAVDIETDANIQRIGEGLWFGFLVGVLLNALNQIGTQGWLHAPFKSLAKVSPSEAKRAITSIPLMLGPTLLAVSYGIKEPYRRPLMLSLIALATITVLTSTHDSSKIAIVGWIIVAGLTYLSLKWASRVVAALWIACNLLVVPISIGAYSAQLQHADWVKTTARQRVYIWNHFSELVMQKPLLGYGFNASYNLRPEVKNVTGLSWIASGKKVPPNLKEFRAMHPHNIYLQVWFEMGAMGALFLSALGLLVLSRIGKASTIQQPFLYASFAALTLVQYSSYGLWQTWFICTILMTFLASSIAMRQSRD